MADNFGVYNITGELESIVSSSEIGALSIHLRHQFERDQRNIEEIERSVEARQHVFVIPETSSSQHEVSSKNSYLSGTVGLEMTAVPASGNVYYSKRQRFIKRTYAVTASAGLPINPANETSPATDEYAARATYLPGSGSYRNNTVFNPAVIEIDIPDYGKIRDIRVWVELIHDHRGGTGSGSFAGNPFLAGGAGAAQAYPKQGLQGLQVALRSPNVTFDYAHPLWNQNTLRTLEKWPTAAVNAPYRKVPELMKNSYLLWAGHSCEEDLGYALGAQTGSQTTYLPSSPFTVRDITSSSIGPGINNANSSDFSPNYALFSYYPAFRTISTIPIAGSYIGVMYPTAWGNPLVNENAVMFITDDGLANTPSPQPFYQQFITSSFYAYGFTNGFTNSNIRMRVQRNSPFVHAACISANPGTGTGIVYGQRQVGDSAAYPWTLKIPVITGGAKDEAMPMGADSFMDFALDTNGKAHFILNQWRGDLGISVLNYVMFPGDTSDYTKGIPGATLAGGGTVGRYKYYRNNTVTGHDAWPDMIAGELDNPFMNDPKLDSTRAGSVGPYCQIEIGTDNVIHILYSDTQNKSVKYAKRVASYTQWSGSFAFEHVFKHPAPATWPTYISMDLDKQNNPHVAYSLFDGVTDNIYYARSGSGGWNLTRIASIPGIKLGTRLKLDNDDVPYITTTITNFDGSGNEAVVLFTSSSFVGWARRNLYYKIGDNPRELSMCFGVDNIPRIYSGGGRLTAMWETNRPFQGKYNEFNTDIDMRTIFADSSKNLNPRDLSWAYLSPSESSPNRSQIYGAAILESRAYSSPFSASIRLLQSAGVWGASSSRIFDPTVDQSNHLTGSNCPWFFDDRVPPGIFKGLNYQATISSTLGLSPPAGWLSGPGATADVNQFPTYGANVGPGTIKPVYPILEDVFVEKILDQSVLTSNTSVLPANHTRLIGFRPGLRGSEIHGKWKLLIGTAGDVSGGNVVANARAGVWFRQVRLEFDLDVGEGVKHTYASKAYRFIKSGNPQREGKKRVQIMSGSAAWDIGINYVFTSVPDQYGTSHGITDLTSSDKFAVFSQITGTLVDLLSGSGDIYRVRHSYLNNEFGTPYIPLSSGSGYLPSFDTFDVAEAKESRDVFAQTLNPKTLIPKDNTLKANLTRADVLKTTRDSLFDRLVLLGKIPGR